jgi:hypothetical protein
MQVKEAWRMMKRHGLNERSIFDGDTNDLKEAYHVLIEYFDSVMADDVNIDIDSDFLNM